jgi:hypothetical protein
MAVGAADAAADQASAAASGTGASASAASTTTASGDANTQGASGSASNTTQASASGELPPQVQEAIADGRYTTEDLNRAMAAAMRAGSGG